MPHPVEPTSGRGTLPPFGYPHYRKLLLLAESRYIYYNLVHKCLQWDNLPYPWVRCPSPR